MSGDALKEELEVAIERNEPFGPSDGEPLQEIPAAALREVILAEREGANALRLQRVKIMGGLDLDGQRIGISIRLEHSELTDDLRLRQASAIDIALFDSTIDGRFFANQLDLRWNLRLNGSTLKQVWLLGAKVGGQLSMNNATLEGMADENGALTALHADGAQMSGGFFGRGITSTGEVRLLGAKVGGQLSMSDATLKGVADKDGDVTALNADGIEVRGDLFCNAMTAEGELRLLGAKVGGQLSVNEATLTGVANRDGAVTTLNADGAEVSGGIFCRATTAEGEVRLLGVKVGGQLSVNKASFKGLASPDGVVTSLNAEAVDLSRGFFGRAMTAEGEVRLLGAKVGGQLSMERSTLKGVADKDGAVTAFNADRAEVSGSFFCRAMTAEGEVRLLGAKVGGQLSMERSTLKGVADKDGAVTAFSADSAEVSGDMFCSGMTSEGELRLPGVKVGGQLGLVAARLSAEPHKGCLMLTAAEIDELIIFLPEVKGVIDLTDAKVRSLWDAQDGQLLGQLPETLCLQGFAYESLREPLSAEQRLEWIECSQRDQHYPGVYAELAAAYRRIGRRSDARKVGIANERRAREDGALPKRIWSYLLWKSVRYGYENWRAVVGLITIIAVGSLLFWLGEDCFVATVKEPPDLSPIIYATDASIPVLDLGQTKTWAADGGLEWVELALAISGYALVAAVIAGLAGIFNRDQV